MKKLLILFITIGALSFAIPPKGGCAPCMATCCFGPRVGLEMNEGTRLTKMEKSKYSLNFFDIVTDYGVELFWGPFTGESMNEIRDREKLGGVSVKGKPPTAENSGGCGPLFTGFCFGPRVAYEMNDGRKIRAIEWWYFWLDGVDAVSGVPLQLIPAVMMAREAYDGKTMSEVVAEEGLDIPDQEVAPKENKKS